MFELGDIRFRPVEKDDLKLLHKWENDFELMMYSRSKPLNFVSMAQIERMVNLGSTASRHLGLAALLHFHLDN